MIVRQKSVRAPSRGARKTAGHAPLPAAAAASRAHPANGANKLHEQTVEVNEALVLGALHQHELTEAADNTNTLLQQEILVREQAEHRLGEAQVLLSDRAAQLEGLVVARTAELTAANQQLEALVYSIAHDLRAPLRSMQGFAALLEEDPGSNLSTSGRDFVRRIDQSTQFMDAMLTDLLAFSRVSQQQIELGPLELAPVVASVLARLEGELRKGNGSVQSEGPWPAVRAHQPTLFQVLFNLVGNAVKFVDPGVPPQLRLWTESRPKTTRVWVEDNGPGIAPEDKDEVFRLFKRLNGGKHPGTGIGLTIVKKGVERMGGHVGVESTPGKGSRFWIELARVEAATPAPGRAAS